MDKYSRYYGVMLFVAVVVIAGYLVYNFVFPKVTAYNDAKNSVISTTNKLQTTREKVKTIKDKLKALKDSSTSVQKKVYAPIEGEMGSDNDSLFFTLYSDVLEMLHSNSIKIKSIDYVYNPANDKFVELGKGQYFVCDVNLELVSNYTNIGKLVQEIYQYPYYIKITSLEVKPYQKDKKILLAKLSLRLYSSTEPVAPESVTPVEKNVKS